MSTLIYYFQYPFVRYALIVGLLIALCASVLGVTLVLRRFSYIGDGLSHVAFGTMAIGAVIGLADEMYFTLPATIICAIFLLKTKSRGDSAIAMLSVGALAVGYMLMNIFQTGPNVSGDICSTLFGSTSILTLTQSEVIMCAILAAIVIIFFVLFYNKIFAVTFDENFSKSTGTNTSLYNTMIAILTATVTVIAMNLVGSLLTSALIVFPALSAMKIFNNFKAVTISAATISVISAAAGIIVSMLAGTPTGPSIVVADIAAFAFCSFAGFVKNR